MNFICQKSHVKNISNSIPGKKVRPKCGTSDIRVHLDIYFSEYKEIGYFTVILYT